MPRPRHPNKEIEAAIVEAESLGWIIEKRSGHAWGIAQCPFGQRGGCRMSIWSTPRNPEAHARQLRRALVRCTHGGEEQE